jgi:hypothetical protein
VAASLPSSDYHTPSGRDEGSRRLAWFYALPPTAQASFWRAVRALAEHAPAQDRAEVVNDA